MGLTTKNYDALLYQSTQATLSYGTGNAILDQLYNNIEDQLGSYILDQNQNLIGVGSAIAVIGPSGFGNVWVPIQVAVTCTGTSTPIGNLYIGPNLPVSNIAALLSSSTMIQQIGGTNTANNSSIGFVSNLTVSYGQALIFQWLGGTPGSQAVMTVTGTQTAQYFR
jgi:hypothetical protein